MKIQIDWQDLTAYGWRHSDRVLPQERASGRRIQFVPTEHPLVCCGLLRAIVRASGKEANASTHISDRQEADGPPIGRGMEWCGQATR